MLRLHGVGAGFAGGVRALDGLDLEVREGELLVLLGPSGCGKTTTLRLIAGLLPPDAGRVERPVRLDGAAGDIGYVLQEPTLMPWATALANVGLPLRLVGTGRAAREARAAALLDRLGLAGFERAYPDQLSGGMRMRVALARALATRPRLLLLDEPFAALDEIARQALDDLLLALWRDGGRSMVFVTHSVWEAAYLASRIVVLTPRPGRVAASFESPLPAARDEALRTGPAYNAFAREVAAALRAAARTPA